MSSSNWTPCALQGRIYLKHVAGTTCKQPYWHHRAQFWACCSLAPRGQAPTCCGLRIAQSARGCARQVRGAKCDPFTQLLRDFSHAKTKGTLLICCLSLKEPSPPKKKHTTTKGTTGQQSPLAKALRSVHRNAPTPQLLAGRLLRPQLPGHGHGLK